MVINGTLRSLRNSPLATDSSSTLPEIGEFTVTRWPKLPGEMPRICNRRRDCSAAACACSTPACICTTTASPFSTSFCGTAPCSKRSFWRLKSNCALANADLDCVTEANACSDVETAASASALSTVNSGCPCRTKSPILAYTAVTLPVSCSETCARRLALASTLPGDERVFTGTMDIFTGSTRICASCGESAAITACPGVVTGADGFDGVPLTFSPLPHEASSTIVVMAITDRIFFFIINLFRNRSRWRRRRRRSDRGYARNSIAPR